MADRPKIGVGKRKVSFKVSHRSLSDLGKTPGQKKVNKSKMEKRRLRKRLEDMKGDSEE